MRDPARPLGLLSLLALGVNGTVGVGIFFAPASVARYAPPGQAAWAFALTALALVPTALCFAQLGRLFPQDGGPVVYARAAFGPRPGFLVGWVAYVGALFSSASIVVGLTRALLEPLGFGTPMALRASSALLTFALAGLAAVGLRPSARVWSALTLLKLAPLVALVAVAAAAGFVLAPVAGLPIPAPDLGGAPAGENSNNIGVLNAVADVNWGRALLAAVFPLQGFEIVPVTAGRARGPREVSAAVLLTLGVSALLYVAVQAACDAALGARLATSAEPVVEAAGAFGGAWLGRLVRGGVNVSALGVAFGYLVMTPRYLSALAAGGELSAGWAEEDMRAVPRRAHWVTAALVAALVASFGTSFDDLLTMASVAVLAQYGATALALVVIAGRGPGSAWRGGLVAVPALVLAVGLVLGASWQEWATGALVVAAGALLRARAVKSEP
ncbi:MAG: APC family permease [Polyangiaceae bacterium]|nr:APC family permease [Polyangiaceae bacterium]